MAWSRVISPATSQQEGDRVQMSSQQQSDEDGGIVGLIATGPVIGRLLACLGLALNDVAFFIQFHEVITITTDLRG